MCMRKHVAMVVVVSETVFVNIKNKLNLQNFNTKFNASYYLGKCSSTSNG